MNSCDLFFFVTLYRGLKPPLAIRAKPKTGYFTEWHFNYEIVCGGKPVMAICGDFRQVKEGELDAIARVILRQQSDLQQSNAPAWAENLFRYRASGISVSSL